MKRIIEVSVNNVEEVVLHIKKALSDLKLIDALSMYRQLERAFPGHEVIGKAKETISDFLRYYFAEFLTGGQRLSDHYLSYSGSITKKIDITREIPGFSDIAKRIIGECRTLLFYDRLYTIYQAVANTRKLGDILELGVFKGGSLKFIAQVCSHFRVAPRIYGLDTFCGHAGISAADVTQFEGHFQDNSVAEVTEYLADQKLVKLVAGDVRDTLVDVLAEIESLAFVHLDMDLREPTDFALKLVEPKLARGGVIVVDDYGFTTCKGVKEVIDAFVARSGFQQIHLMTGQCWILEV